MGDEYVFGVDVAPCLRSLGRLAVILEDLRWYYSNVDAFELWREWRHLRRVNFASYGGE